MELFKLFIFRISTLSNFFAGLHIISDRGFKMEYEVFYAEIREGNETLEITIPKKVCEYAGFKKGDQVKCMIKKAE